MLIKEPIELFTKVGVINQYNSLVNQLSSIGLNLQKLAIAKTYAANLFEEYEWVDNYNQKYTYGCLSELKAEFKNKTGGDLNLVYLEVKDSYSWQISNFYIKVINPEVFNICRNELTYSHNWDA